jgi:hypothetical protein
MAQKPTKTAVNPDLKHMRLFASLGVHPKVLGGGVFKIQKNQNYAWQAMELYDGNLQHLLLDSDLCAQNLAAIKDIEYQLFEMFNTLAGERYFCFDVKPANTVYRIIQETQHIEVKLIDMDNDFCFMPLYVRFDDLTTEEVLFAQLVVFSNNSTGDNGECPGYPFFMNYLQSQAAHVRQDKVLLLLSTYGVAKGMYNYGKYDNAPKKLPHEKIDELAQEALAKAVYNKPTKLLTTRQPSKPSNATHLSGGASKRRKATTRRLRTVSKVRRPRRRRSSKLSRKTMHSR